MITCVALKLCYLWLQHVICIAVHLTKYHLVRLLLAECMHHCLLSEAVITKMPKPGHRPMLPLLGRALMEMNACMCKRPTVHHGTAWAHMLLPWELWCCWSCCSFSKGCVETLET